MLLERKLDSVSEKLGATVLLKVFKKKRGGGGGEGLAGRWALS